MTRISALTWSLLAARPLLALVPYSVVRPWVERGELVTLQLPLQMPFEPLGMLRPGESLSAACEALVSYLRRSGSGIRPGPLR